MHTVALIIMTIRLFIAFFFIILFSSCKKDVEDGKVNVPSKEIKKKKSLNDTLNFEKKLANFSMLYKYADDESSQTLGITLLKNHTANFYLFTETLPCDTEYWGIAKCEYWNMDPETDEDENGLYPSREYSTEKDNYDLSIRIALDSTKVVIKFAFKDSSETDCFPIVETIMKRIK